jgi:hypothetical protein
MSDDGKDPVAVLPPPGRPPQRTTSTDTADSRDSSAAFPTLAACVYGLAEDESAVMEFDSTEEENCAALPVTPGHVVDLKLLRRLASRGIPDEGSHRGAVWRLLLGYLPAETNDWETALQTRRGFYQGLVTDLFADAADAHDGGALRGRPRPRSNSLPDGAVPSDFSDHTDDSNGTPATDVPDLASESSRPESSSQSPLPRPTAELPESIIQAWKDRGKDRHVLDHLMNSWNALRLPATVAPEHPSPSAADETAAEWTQRAVDDFCESAVLLDEVRKDVVRTHPDLAFFLHPRDDLGARRYAALERILFVWATYNKGVRYVQGMNEIVGAIYYVLAKDYKEEWAAHAEADTYHLFSTLLAEMRDVFVADLDDADTGIQGRLAHMHKLLQVHDPEVKEHLDEVEIDVSFYAVRWWTTLLSREFLLPDTIRLWDSMFASTHKDNFMRYVCVTMVLTIRDSLLKGDFSTCIKLLQGYPPTHMDHLIESSRALWIYETQVTLAIHKGGFSRHMALQTIQPPHTLIMAFGFRRGIAPKTRSEQLEEVGERAADRVRDATTAVAASARSYLGKASGFLNKHMNRRRTNSTDSEISNAGGGTDTEEVIKFSEDKMRAFEDDRYLAEFS